ncbi:MAG: hypothetical protein V1859_08335 [archaeon]
MRAKNSENSEKKKKIAMVIFTAIFLISSIAAVVLYRVPETTDSIRLNLSGKYYEFTREQNYFVTKIDTETVKFYSLPYDVENIKVDQELINTLKGTSYIFVTFDPIQEGLSEIDLLLYDFDTTFSGMNKFILKGNTKESEIYNYPIISCLNATSFTPVIELKTSNATKIEKIAGNCYSIESRYLGFLKARDRLIYGIKGLI